MGGATLMFGSRQIPGMQDAIIRLAQEVDKLKKEVAQWTSHQNSLKQSNTAPISSAESSESAEKQEQVRLPSFNKLIHLSAKEVDELYSLLQQVRQQDES